jgi:hypothetical protein
MSQTKARASAGGSSLSVYEPSLQTQGLAISLTYPSLERDFYRRRQTRKKGTRGDVSKQRPEIGDHDAREMAAKKAFLLAGYQSHVSEDWVVGAPGLEPGTR